MNDEEKVRRAEHARQIIEDSLWIEAWAEYRKHWIGEIEGADTGDLETIQEAKRSLDLQSRLRAFFEAVLMDGKVSAETIKMEKARKLGQMR